MPLDPQSHGAVPGSILGNYRIERLLGRGGMGSVFLAYDTTLRRHVALKLLAGSEDPSLSRAQVLREGRSAAALNHPGICTIHEVGDAQGTAFIAMEYVEGRSLRERLEGGGLPLDDLLRHAIQVADALGYAHQHGVVHRDLKAANVIVAGSGRVKIVDFGLARRGNTAPGAATTVTASVVPAGTAAGTPYAMAPEQVRGEATDSRTDVWAVGVLLHEMATGRPPFAGATLPDVFSAILRDAPPPLPPGMPVVFGEIVRRCLEKDPAARYQQAGEIRAALEAIGPGTTPAVPVGGHTWLRRRAGLLAAAVLVAGLAGTAYRWWPSFGGQAPIRLAVLPFRNLTGDAAQEVFSDGLTEETIAQLGRLHSTPLRIISGRSSGRYRGADVPLDRIGRELGVDYVLEGSTRREGTKVRLTAALIRVSDQGQQWADTFERDMAGILGLQSDLARGVATALSVALVPSDQTRLASAPAVDPVAYEAYLKGLGHASRFTRPDLDRALEYFETAIARDPKFALGYVGIANVWSARQQMQFATAAEAGPRIRAAGAAARALDPDLPEVHYRLAVQYAWTDWNWAAAEPEFRRAIKLRPDYPEAHAFYSHYLLLTRREAAAIAEIEHAIRVDPLNDEIQSLHGVVLMMTGRVEEAAVQFRSAIKTASRSPIPLNGLSRALYHMGRLEEALTAEQAVWAARGDGEIVAALERGGRAGGYRAAMRAAAEVLAARARATHTAPLSLALLYLRSGDTQQAIDWAERSVEAHDPNAPYISVGPHWAAVRTDPRVQALIRRVNLPE